MALPLAPAPCIPKPASPAASSLSECTSLDPKDYVYGSAPPVPSPALYAAFLNMSMMASFSMFAHAPQPCMPWLPQVAPCMGRPPAATPGASPACAAPSKPATATAQPIASTQGKMAATAACKPRSRKLQQQQAAEGGASAGESAAPARPSKASKTSKSSGPTLPATPATAAAQRPARSDLSADPLQALEPLGLDEIRKLFEQDDQACFSATNSEGSNATLFRSATSGSSVALPLGPGSAATHAAATVCGALGTAAQDASFEGFLDVSDPLLQLVGMGLVPDGVEEGSSADAAGVGAAAVGAAGQLRTGMSRSNSARLAGAKAAGAAAPEPAASAAAAAAAAAVAAGPHSGITAHLLPDDFAELSELMGSGGNWDAPGLSFEDLECL